MGESISQCDHTTDIMKKLLVSLKDSFGIQAGEVFTALVEIGASEKKLFRRRAEN